MKGIEGVEGIEGIRAIEGIEGIRAIEGIRGIEGIEGIEGVEGVGPEKSLDSGFVSSHAPKPAATGLKAGRGLRAGTGSLVAERRRLLNKEWRNEKRKPAPSLKGS